MRVDCDLAREDLNDEQVRQARLAACLASVPKRWPVEETRRPLHGAGRVIEPEPPDDWPPEPDENLNFYVESERLSRSREPFSFLDEYSKAITAAFDGDVHYQGKRDFQRRQDEDFWRGRRYLVEFALEDLRALYEYAARYDRNEPSERDLDDLQTWEDEDRYEVYVEAVGRRLYQLDPDLWRMLLLFGPTPALLARARSLLLAPRHGLVVESRADHRPNPRHARRGARARGRRTVRRRATSRAGPTGDDGPASRSSGALALAREAA